QKADNGFKGIQSKPKQAIIHLTNPNMLDETGYIQTSSNIFQDHGANIDVCTTSEVSVTYSVNEKDISNRLLRALRRIGNVTVHHGLAKITILGENINTDSRAIATTFKTIQSHKVHAVSMGASNHNITFLVDEKEAPEILKKIHHELIKKGRRQTNAEVGFTFRSEDIEERGKGSRKNSRTLPQQEM
ncbi:MAG: hypothetical protein U1C97_02735, partial [Candidatus Gracilibacteria bacterium]|nr:hypothetical protein [Candidatus Gracilibacteria bacterium]